MDKSFIARETARLLLEVEAIQFNPEKPYIFTSGWASPVYTDCRKLISFPRLRKRLMSFAEEIILSEIGAESLDAVAGGETAGIPFAAWLSDRLELPMLYVRKKPKGFGRNAQIEGDVKEGARAILVEDLASDGRSKLIFTKAMRDAGLQVSHAFVVFHYGSLPVLDRGAGRRRHHAACAGHLVGRVGRSQGLEPLPGGDAGGSRDVPARPGGVVGGRPMGAGRSFEG